LFIAVVSAHTEQRDGGYFRLECKLAIDRSHLMAAKKAFIVPVVIDGTSERSASVPDKFHELQWTRLSGGDPNPAFVERIQRLLSSTTATQPAPSSTARCRYAWTNRRDPVEGDEVQGVRFAESGASASGKRIGVRWRLVIHLTDGSSRTVGSARGEGCRSWDSLDSLDLTCEAV
jgi:hypothetical protein